MEVLRQQFSALWVELDGRGWGEDTIHTMITLTEEAEDTHIHLQHLTPYILYGTLRCYYILSDRVNGASMCAYR